MYKVAILDDEQNSAFALEKLIGKYCPKLEIIKILNDPREGLEFLLSNKVDLLFLDIQMPHITGLELLKKIPNKSFHVIFTTAYDQFAIEAIKLSALDYLLKPIDPEQLVLSVSRFLNSHSNQKIQELLSEVGTNSSNKLVIQLQDKTLFLDFDEIYYLEAESNYTHIHMFDGNSYMTSKTIKYYEELLKQQGFFRSHQSFLINLSYIREYSKPDHTIVLKNGKHIPVSKNKKDGLLKKLT